MANKEVYQWGSPFGSGDGGEGEQDGEGGQDGQDGQDGQGNSGSNDNSGDNDNKSGSDDNEEEEWDRSSIDYSNYSPIDIAFCGSEMVYMSWMGGGLIAMVSTSFVMLAGYVRMRDHVVANCR